MTAYYNEIDPYAAQWLRNLITAGHISPGDVDERSIADVHPNDLRGYTQCHFFAGLGGWSYAARLAGWPDDRDLWTGSCPCQPFSVAGKGEGQADIRHLWPVFFDLISARRPAVVMGEQVAAAVGKDWLDGVHSDLEGIGYACGAAVVPACAVDAPHRRDRLWFISEARVVVNSEGFRPVDSNSGSLGGAQCSLQGEARQRDGEAARASSVDGSLANASSQRSQTGFSGSKPGQEGDAGELNDRDRQNPMANTHKPLQGQGWEQRGREFGWTGSNSRGSTWVGDDWLAGADGKARRIEPSIRLLAHGVPARVGKLRAYGNAIVPALAAQVIGAYLDIAP